MLKPSLWRSSAKVHTFPEVSTLYNSFIGRPDFQKILRYDKYRYYISYGLSTLVTYFTYGSILEPSNYTARLGFLRDLDTHAHFKASDNEF